VFGLGLAAAAAAAVYAYCAMLSIALLWQALLDMQYVDFEAICTSRRSESTCVRMRASNAPTEAAFAVGGAGWCWLVLLRRWC
jgi:hypothetical protein